MEYILLNRGSHGNNHRSLTAKFPGQTEFIFVCTLRDINLVAAAVGFILCGQLIVQIQFGNGAAPYRRHPRRHRARFASGKKTIAE